MICISHSKSPIDQLFNLVRRKTCVRRDDSIAAGVVLYFSNFVENGSDGACQLLSVYLLIVVLVPCCKH